MNQNEIIEMARQAGFFINDKLTVTSPFIEDICISPMLKEFAKLVEEKEREACAKVCDEISLRASGIHDAMTDDRNDEPILYMTGKELGSKSCADAIRARGEA